MIHELFVSLVASVAICVLFYGALASRPPQRRAPHQPTSRETYVRLELESIQGWAVIPGLELRETDDLAELREELMEVLNAWLPVGWKDERELAGVLAKQLTEHWPGRAWFLEVEGKDGEWVQVYQPWTPTLSKTAISGVA